MPLITSSAYFVPTTNAVNFDGTNDYLTVNGDLSGNSNSRRYTLSVWIKTTSTDIIIFDTKRLAFSGVYAKLDTNGKLEAGGREDNSLTTILKVTSTSALNDGAWHHILLSLDLVFSSLRGLYIDDVSDSTAVWGTYINDTLRWASNDSWAVGGAFNGTKKWNGDMAELWVEHTRLDLGVEANRRKWITDGGTPADVGADGSTPTASQPLMYFGGPTDTWHTNKGDGGGFTENGALTTASTSPSV